MGTLQTFLQQSASRHSHLCPRQVLGVRIAMAGLAAFQLPAPPPRARLLVIAETAGCFVDGLEVVAGVTVGHRSLRIEDYGKVAATFVDLESRCALRIAPVKDLRSRAQGYAPAGEKRRYFIQLHAYQVMPERELLSIQPVELNPPLAALLGRAGARTICRRCGEEIINLREVKVGGQTVCQACAGFAYYAAANEPAVE